MIETIPLDKLMLSNLNVRRTERDADITALADDIAARGLKQNLVVIPAHFMTGESRSKKEGGKGWQGMYEVIAGGRRYQAMQLLVESGRMSADQPVACLIEEREEASETSLAENLHRVAMNPADEFNAFKAIVDVARERMSDVDPVAYCAKRFGVTVKHVQGRLRLAALAPEILEALRANIIGLDSAKAYAGVEDHELQRKVFEAQCKSTWQAHHPNSVRGALRGETLPLDCDLIQFVGLEAYRKAGGRTEVEMFMGSDGEERITDLTLLAKLAQEKAEPMVAPQARKDGFKDGLLVKKLGYGTWPSPPEGMERYIRYYEGKDPTKAELKKCTAVYDLDVDGLGLISLGHFRPAKPKEEQESRDWEAERAARAREHQIETRAARLAVYEIGKFDDTPFKGHAFWPRWQPRLVETREEEGCALVAIQIRVPIASITAHRAEAERQIDEEAAAAEAAKAADDDATDKDAAEALEQDA